MEKITIRVEIMNQIERGRAVGNDWVLVERTARRSNVLAHFGGSEFSARITLAYLTANRTKTINGHDLIGEW